MLSGAFGGVSTAMVMAIIGDVVPAERRAAGVGIVMTAFSVAAAVGIPFGLQLAQHFRWEAPFFMVASIAGVMWVIAFLRLPPVRGHLEKGDAHAARAFPELLRDANAGRALLFMTTLVFGHFAIIPLLSAYLVANVGLPERDLFLFILPAGALGLHRTASRQAGGFVRALPGLVRARRRGLRVTLAITHSAGCRFGECSCWRDCFSFSPAGGSCPAKRS